MIQYLQQNKVNYLPQSDLVVYTHAIDTHSNCNYIQYNTSVSYDIHYIDLNKYVDTTNNTIINYTTNTACNMLIYTLSLSFGHNDFINIKQDDTITFTVTINDIVHTYTYQLLPQFLNTYILRNKVNISGTLRTFTVSYESTQPLVYKRVHNDGDTDVIDLILV